MVLLALAMIAISGTAETLVFQEGTAGYSGVADSYIGSGGYYALKKQNFGTAGTMLLGFEHYQSG